MFKGANFKTKGNLESLRKNLIPQIFVSSFVNLSFLSSHRKIFLFLKSSLKDTFSIPFKEQEAGERKREREKDTSIQENSTDWLLPHVDGR